MDSYDHLKAHFDRIAAVNRQRIQREAFRAGFMAHPETPSTWSFDPATCAAADREESAWQAYCESSSQK